MDGAIAKLSERMNKLVEAGDIPGILQILTADVVFMPPGAPPKVGADAYREWVTEFQKHYSVRRIEVESRELEIGDKWAYEWGLVREEYAPRGNEQPGALVGKFMRVFRREPSGDWKIARAIWNSNT